MATDTIDHKLVRKVAESYVRAASKITREPELWIQGAVAAREDGEETVPEDEDAKYRCAFGWAYAYITFDTAFAPDEDEQAAYQLSTFYADAVAKAMHGMASLADVNDDLGRAAAAAVLSAAALELWEPPYPREALIRELMEDPS